MIDTSALIAILNREAPMPDIVRCVEETALRLVSAGTLSELLIVAAGRKFTDEALRLIDEIDPEIVPVDKAMALAVGDACTKWGKGNHPAQLNFGDCFAYALAKQRNLPLLYVGEDFARTDVRSAL